jgi:hypothetical protein
MGRQHIRNGILSIVQRKTGMAVDVPVTRTLQAAIDAAPNNHLTFLVTSFGQPFLDRRSAALHPRGGSAAARRTGDA